MECELYLNKCIVRKKNNKHRNKVLEKARKVKIPVLSTFGLHRKDTSTVTEEEGG